MEIKTIRSKKDYEAPLKEIERLFDAKPGTADGDRLEVLTVLVHKLMACTNTENKIV